MMLSLFTQMNKMLLRSLFVIVLVLLVSTVQAEEPVNKEIPMFAGKAITGSLEFDCAVRLKAPVVKEDNIFFIHYTVSSEAISYDIVWAEPSWEHLNFPYPPFGMSMYADKSRFLLYHTWNDVRWEKDIANESRGVFKSTCNTYPLEDAGFAYQESLERRLFLSDKHLFPQSERMFHGIPLERSTKRNVQIKLSDVEPNYTQFEIYRKNPEQYKGQAFFYNEDGSLHRLAADSGEITIPVSGFNVQVRTNEFPDGINFSQLPAKYQKGGRMFRVFFSKVKLGEKMMELPSNIEILTRTVPSEVLREVTFSDYRLTNEAVVPKNLGHFFLDEPRFADEQKFRQLSKQYWLQPKESVSGDDTVWLSNFSEDCLRRLSEESRIPYRLKLLYMSICGDLLTGNTKRIEQSTFELYFSELQKTGYESIANKGKEQFVRLCKEWYGENHIEIK